MFKLLSAYLQIYYNLYCIVSPTFHLPNFTCPKNNIFFVLSIFILHFLIKKQFKISSVRYYKKYNNIYHKPANSKNRKKMGNKMCCEQVQQNKITIQVGNPEVKSTISNNPNNPSNLQNSQLQNSNIKIEPQPIRDDLLINSRKSQIQKQPSAIHQASGIKLESATEPTLPIKIQQNLEKFNPFYTEINSYSGAVKVGNSVYRGSLNQKGEPHGYGKMFYPNNTVLIGKFQNGIPNGPAHYIWPDGSFYQGNVQNNKANDSLGTYTCPQYIYKGSIKNNTFQGEGTLEQQDNRYKFSGIFENNKRTYGKQTWKQVQRRSLPLSSSQSEYDVQYAYEGNFDENEEFTGIGKLTSSYGVYKGPFKNGMKNGKGTFQFKNGIKYEGDYKDNIKQGFATVYNKTGTISYEGEFYNGLPHGKGKAPKDGKFYEVQWVEGLSSELVQDKNQTPAKRLNN